VPLEAYRENLEAIFGCVLRSEARLVWATITPIDERARGRTALFDRRDSDLKAFQIAALEVARKHGVPVNDLWAFVQTSLEAPILSDGVHFDPNGYKAIGRVVAEVLRPYIT